MPESYNEINAGNYTVFIGDDVLIKLDDFIKKRGSSGKKFILVDENTLKHCLPVLIETCPVLKDAEIIEIESGEENKNIDICTGIWKTLTEHGADRKSLMVNLGGGMISDLGGFAASTFKRGIDFINIPTSLLSQTDASVGGKTGIDMDHYKNEVGTFADPAAVFIYPDYLKTLPYRQITSGFAEVIKHALIADHEYWETLKNIELSLENDWLPLIRRSVEIKRDLVLADPKESGVRKVLNFGHTIGHAFESFFLEKGKNKLLHGEAVAIGMIAEAYISHKFIGLKENELNKITGFILSVYEDLKLYNVDTPEIIDRINHDKKNIGSTLNFTLLNMIGKSQINCNCSIELIKESLEYFKEKAHIPK